MNPRVPMRDPVSKINKGTSEADTSLHMHAHIHTYAPLSMQTCTRTHAHTQAREGNLRET